MPESFWVRSYLSTPIIINDQIYGFINCDDRTANAFSENHANKVKLLADQAAIAIENAQVYSETRNRLKQIALINELTQSMLDSKQLDDILLTLAKRIMFIFDANSLLITKWDEENNLASLLTSYGDGLMPNIPKSNKVGEFSLTEEVIKQKHAIVVDAKGDYKTWSEELSKIFLDRVILALPMTTREKSLGAILIGFKNPKRITQAEISIGEYASLQIATILQKSNAFEKAQEQSAQFQHANDLIASLSIVATSILSTKGLEDIIKTMGEGLEKMNIHSSMFFNNSDPRTLQLDYCSRMTELKSLLKNLGHPSDKKLFIETPRTDQFHNTLYNQQIEFINDLAQLLKFSIPSKFGPFIGKFQEALDIGPDTKSLFMPLIVERKTIGLLGLYGRDLQEIDLKAGEIFNSQISVALENSRLLAEVQRLAVTDELTKINNRRGLFESGNRELLAAKRLNRSLSVLMIDLDIFKDVNDKYGHAVGDVTLSEVARRIAVNIREIDIVGRYGGEEFVALLPETDLPKALLVAERIRKAVADERILTEAGPIQVTVSIGIDELSIMTNSLEQLIKSADRALYIAKRNGRNQVATLSKIEKSHS